MKKTILFLLAAVSLLTASARNPKQPIDWHSDLDSLAAGLIAKHYNFFTVRSREEFRTGIEALKSESAALGDFRTALKAQQLIASFGDSHTVSGFISLADRTRVIPFQLLWTSDGLHIRQIASAHRELLGRRVTAINGFPIETVIDSLSTLFTIDNQAVVKSIIPQFIPCLEILAHFGFSDTPETKLTLAEGDTHRIPSSVPDKKLFASFQPDSLCYADANRKVLFTACSFPAERIYYMLYNSCYSRELAETYGDKKKAASLPSFEQFGEEALQTLAAGQTDKLIFDMRYNGGGNSYQGTAWIETLSKFLKTHPGISVYVVLGRQTYSSAILNAMDFKRLTNAVFVGEQTAGKPNHFGEVRSFRLPSSGIRINYSTNYFKTSDEDLSTLTPDVVIECSFGDYASGKDPVFDWICRQPAAKRK